MCSTSVEHAFEKAFKIGHTAVDRFCALVLFATSFVFAALLKGGFSMSSALLQLQQRSQRADTTARGPPRMLRGTGRVPPSPM